MAIRIINLHNYKLNPGEVLYKVDRSNKVLGNPFFMDREEDRNIVCDKYHMWFHAMLTNPDHKIHEEIRKIIAQCVKHDVALGCWCYPKRCHAETIQQFINSL